VDEFNSDFAVVAEPAVETGVFYLSRLLDSQADILLDPLLDPSISVGLSDRDKQTDNAETYGDEWDDDLDGEGEIDTSWDVEHDARSNESSITLSSSMSSKRTYGEVEIDDDERDNAAGSPASGASFVYSYQMRHSHTFHRNETAASPMISFESALHGPRHSPFPYFSVTRPSSFDPRKLWTATTPGVPS